MSNTNKKDYDNIVSKGLISVPAQESYLKRLKKLGEVNKKLEESADKRKKKNDKFISCLPKGFTFIVGNFEITV